MRAMLRVLMIAVGALVRPISCQWLIPLGGASLVDGVRMTQSEVTSEGPDASNALRLQRPRAQISWEPRHYLRTVRRACRRRIMCLYFRTNEERCLFCFCDFVGHRHTEILYFSLKYEPIVNTFPLTYDISDVATVTKIEPVLVGCNELSCKKHFVLYKGDETFDLENAREQFIDGSLLKMGGVIVLRDDVLKAVQKVNSLKHEDGFIHLKSNNDCKRLQRLERNIVRKRNFLSDPRHWTRNGRELNREQQSLATLRFPGST